MLENTLLEEDLFDDYCQEVYQYIGLNIRKHRKLNKLSTKKTCRKT